MRSFAVFVYIASGLISFFWSMSVIEKPLIVPRTCPAHSHRICTLVLFHKTINLVKRMLRSPLRTNNFQVYRECFLTLVFGPDR